MLDELKEDDEKYLKFYTNFSKKIKLGVYEDAKYRERFTKLLMFNTSKSEDKLRSLDQYVEDMPEDQPGIYYITGESKQIVKNSPFVEKLNKKGWEVLYFVDPLDEYMTQQLKEYREKKLLCVTKSDLDLGDSEEEKKTIS
jgi:molecular chaperone HtpG